MKYELLLKAIYEHTERAGLKDELPNLHVAIEVMRVSIFHIYTVSRELDVKFNAASLKMLKSNFRFGHFWLAGRRLYRKRQTI